MYGIATGNVLALGARQIFDAPVPAHRGAIQPPMQISLAGAGPHGLLHIVAGRVAEQGRRASLMSWPWLIPELRLAVEGPAQAYPVGVPTVT